MVVFDTGMSHQIHGERCGLINEEWDQQFLDRLTADPIGLSGVPQKEYVTLAGAEGIELVMRHLMRGALNDDVDELYRVYPVPASKTVVGNIIPKNRGA